MPKTSETQSSEQTKNLHDRRKSQINTSVLRNTQTSEITAKTF